MLGSSSQNQLNYSFKILLVRYMIPLPALTWGCASGFSLGVPLLEEGPF